MKNKYFSRLLILGVFMTFGLSIQAQKKVELEKIKGKYNQEKLSVLKKTFKQKASLEKQNAISIANAKGWQTKFTNSKGELLEIQRVVDGKPIYYTTFNVDAATSTRTDHLNAGGSLGLNLMGQNMTAHVWDGGLARASHQEYDGAGGTNRFSIGDGTTTLHYHSAHVTGTIIASGVDANAKGMAPHASAVGYDWNSDTSEATGAASNGMLISNHSYGFRASQLPDYYFGGYITDSRDWDEIMFNAPNYLMVVAAGNDGNDNSSNGSPLGGNSSYDKLSGHATAKNNMVVANANDANIDTNGNLLSVSINSSSSEGPTDDYRIKPDITGNGTAVYSTYESSNTDYNSITGTSMASPNVAGTLLILQQHANDVRGSFIKASTLKGIALHTADDAGATGPDAVYGWGLLNAKRAAQAITQNGNESKVEELTLTNGQTYQITVDSDGINDLMASISWTDRAGVASTATNSSSPVLVNDLDIRVSKNGTTYTPWKLTGVATNGKGDNNVDPYERVDVANASGTYTISVTNKGSLTGGSQNYSLIITGLTGTPVVCNATTPDNLTIDGFGSSTATVSWDAVPGSSYDFRYRQSGTTTWTTSTVAGTSTSLAGLNSETTYEVQVRSTCPDNATSAYSASVSFTTSEIQLNYCSSNGNSVVDEYISKVVLGSINNTTGAASSGYADYTSQSTVLTKGTSATITITPTWTGTLYNEGYAVFIDYNKDGDFTDNGETIWSKSASTTTPVSGAFTIPTSAITGATRMRVVMQYNAIPSSCGSYNYGETEDYTVNITDGVADTTAPIITLTGASTINVTQGDAYNELGATATDNVDGNLTANIVIGGDTVDTNTVNTYVVTYNVSDAAGNAATEVSRTVHVNAPAADTQAPTIPTNLTVSNITETTASLSWSASSDNVGVTAYEIFSSGTSIGSVSSTSANLTGLTAATSYSYTVNAKDAAGNVSAQSTSVTFTTLDGSTGSTTVLHEGFFESGWDGWSDGGSDCYRYSGSRSFEGNRSIRLRDNSGTGSAMTSSSFNLTSFNSVEVTFYFYARSMENGEDFWLRFYNGSSWSTVAAWARGTSFNNNTFYSATVTLNGTDVNFASNSAFRFQNDASKNDDHIYIDQVTITGIIGNGGSSINSVNEVNSYYTTESASNKEFGDNLLYPNPTSAILNINTSFGAIKSNYRITNLLGQLITSGTIKNNTIDISTLKKGIYLIELTDEEETFIQKFIKQ